MALEGTSDTSRRALQFPNYEVFELITNNRTRAVYSGRRTSDGTLVSIKKPHGHNSDEILFRCRSEFELLESLSGVPGVIQAYEIVATDTDAAIVVEHIGGVFPQEWLKTSERSLLEKLNFALSAATIIGRVHEAGVIHQDISPESFLIDPASGEVTLLNFLLGARLGAGDKLGDIAAWASGSLHYISPEQTGRTNRQVDERSDWYSFGLLLYELLGGRLPFESGDPLDWIHFHLAGETAPLSSMNPDIPVMLTRIVDKLVRREPADRYQSSKGLIADLSRCLDALEDHAEIAEFELGQDDALGRFILPAASFAREEQLEQLSAAFDRITAGGTEIIHLVGKQGAGKSALARELRQIVSGRRGFFVSGTCRADETDSAYSPLLAALRELIAQLLTESEQSIRRWRDLLLTALGSNAQLIIDVLPELEYLTGPQEAVARLPDNAAKVRFQSTFSSFILALASETHPLVIHLERMQWADLPTRELIDLLFRDQSAKSLMLIESFDRAEPVADDDRNDGIEPVVVALNSLNTAQIEDYLADALQHRDEATSLLAQIVQQKTEGKPEYIQQFLLGLHDSGLITFDSESRCFLIDIEGARETETTENVAEAMAERLSSLDPATRNALQLAAVAGRSFDTSLIAHIADCSSAEVMELLRPAYEAGYIIAMPDQAGTGAGRVFAFSHDHLHEAVYACNSKEERASLHLSIGRALLETSDDKVLERSLLDTVSHFNHAENLIESEVERLRIAELNLRAAEKMRNAAAYGTAARHYETGLNLLGPQRWQTHHSLTLKIQTRLIEVLLQENRLEDALSQLTASVAEARTIADAAHLHAMKVSALMRTKGPATALEYGLEALTATGLEHETDNTSGANVEAILNDLLPATDNSGIDALIDLPSMSNRDEIGQMELMRRCIPAAYQTDWNIFGSICCRMIRMSLERGNCTWSAGAYGSVAVLLTTLENRYRDADRFAKLGIDLAERLDAQELRAEAILLRAMFTSHWIAPVQKSIELYDKAIKTAEQTGDLHTYAYARARRLGHLLCRGDSFLSFRDEALEARKTLQALGETPNALVVQCYLELTDWITADSTEASVESEQRETRQTAAIQEQDNLSLQCDWYIILQRKRYLAEDYESALDFTRALDALVSHSRAFIIESEHAFYAALSAAALYGGAREQDKPGYLEQIDARLRQLELWSELCPQNRASLLQIVAAERARITGDGMRAISLYDEALSSSRDNGLLHLEALAAELVARFWSDADKPDFANLYLERAISSYQALGAARMVRTLTARRDPRGTHTANVAITRAIRQDQINSADKSIDLAAVIKSSQAIAGEIVLERLLGRLIDIVLENAGGDRIALVLPSDDGLVIQGMMENTNQPPQLMLNEQVERSSRISRRIVNYVLRTKEHLVLSEPAHGGPFQGDSYVQNRQPKSVLCAPVSRKNKLAGIVYIENTQIADAFTPDRLEALDILLAQIAISIDNARLYAQQDEQNRNIERANTALTKEVVERKRAESQLSRYRDHLEELVAQRTHELEKLNHKLIEEAHGRETALKQLENSNEQIRSLAYLDGLTGLPNRRLLNEHLDKILARCMRKNTEFALLFVDLDNFKLLNDTVGHQAADEVLCELSNALSELIRSADVLAAHMDNEIDLDSTVSPSPITESVLSRLGGDEFVVLLPEIRDRFSAASVAQRILDRLDRPFLIDGTEIFIHASVGIATFPNDGETAEVLLRNADTAMYHAKESGKGTYQYYSDEMNAASVERLRLENGLRKALEENQFELHYQPQVDIASGRIVGAEALIRWKDPTRGYIPPNTFIPVAESGGMIVQIGDWVLDQAARQLAEWREQGLPELPVAINISATQFKRQNVAEEVLKALKRYDLSPSALSVEITETSLMVALDKAVQVLCELRELGVKTALDDFGTGYSSLSYLKAFPLDALKIDRTFVAEMLTDTKTAALTEAIINMTSILDLKVVAEGVEDQAQLEHLRKLGCSTAQGYFFSAAVGADEFARLATAQPASWRPRDSRADPDRTKSELNGLQGR